MSNEAPEEVWIDNGQKHFDCDSILYTALDYAENGYPNHYIRSDIAQAQTNKRVREVLLQIRSSVENDSHIDVLVGINKLLNEYPDLLTNEDEMV